MRIDSNEAAGFTEHFDEIRVHQTEISNYVKRDGRCVISIQSAVEYFYYKTASGKLISGDKEYKTDQIQYGACIHTGYRYAG